MTPHKYKHIFGPVLSRRLGRSLGVDIMPFKTCTYDCIYCEQARTTNHTACRKDYVPIDDVLSELEDYLAHHSDPDYVTLSGAGEPTLHARLGEIVEGAKSLTKVPLAAITNGSLLWDASVRDALHDADVVLPSLDAGNAHLFDYINRPVPEMSFEKMATGLVVFRQSFRKTIWLEVLLLAEITSGEQEIQEIAEWVSRIRPDRVQLNTVVRPPTESFALPIARERLKLLAAFFEPHAEIIADYCGVSQDFDASSSINDVLELVKRRPCSVQEIAGTLGLRPVEVGKLVDLLISQNRMTEKHFGNDRFFMAIADECRCTDTSNIKEENR